MEAGYDVSILCPMYIGLGLSLLNAFQWVSNKRRIKSKPLTVVHDQTPTYPSLSSQIPSQVSLEHMWLLPPSALYTSSSPSASVRLSVPRFFTVVLSSVGSWLKSQVSKRPSSQPPKHLSLFNSFLHGIHFYLKLSYLLVRLLSVSTRMEVSQRKRPRLPCSLLMILYRTHRKDSLNSCGMKNKRLTEPSIGQEWGALCSHSNLLLIHYVPWSSPILIEFWVFVH